MTAALRTSAGDGGGSAVPPLPGMIAGIFCGALSVFVATGGATETTGGATDFDGVAAAWLLVVAVFGLAAGAGVGSCKIHHAVLLRRVPVLMVVSPAL